MRRKHQSMIAIHDIGLVLLALCFFPEASAFNEHELLNVKIRATTIKGESIDQILGRLTSDYEIRVGDLGDEILTPRREIIRVGMDLGDQKLIPRREINLDLPETNLKDFLDSVIAKDPRYTWTLEGGVIHVWPVSERDALIATLLDTKISHFAIIGEVSRNAIYNDIMDLPEIRSKLVVAGVEPLTFFQGLGSRPKLAKETFFNESNLTLRELLDKIVLKTEIRQWVINRWGKHSEYISLKGG